MKMLPYEGQYEGWKPYDLWNTSGPRFDSVSGRMVITLSCPDKTVTINYSRYLMERHLGRYLESWEDVHHKDENKQNDDLNNLEIKDKRLHLQEHKLNLRETVICLNCNEKYELTPAQKYYRSKKPRALNFCCRGCEKEWRLKK